MSNIFIHFRSGLLRTISLSRQSHIYLTNICAKLYIYLAKVITQLVKMLICVRPFGVGLFLLDILLNKPRRIFSAQRIGCLQCGSVSFCLIGPYLGS